MAGAVEQAIFGMEVKMDERFGHDREIPGTVLGEEKWTDVPRQPSLIHARRLAKPAPPIKLENGPCRDAGDKSVPCLQQGTFLAKLTYKGQ
jgi:hypothetical protein